MGTTVYHGGSCVTEREGQDKDKGYHAGPLMPRGRLPLQCLSAARETIERVKSKIDAGRRDANVHHAESHMSLGVCLKCNNIYYTIVN